MLPNLASKCTDSIGMISKCTGPIDLLCKLAGLCLFLGGISSASAQDQPFVRCPVSNDLYSSSNFPVIGKCQHIICKKCSDAAKSNEYKCPICKGEIAFENSVFYHNTAFVQLLKSEVPQLFSSIEFEEEQFRRKFVKLSDATRDERKQYLANLTTSLSKIAKEAHALQGGYTRFLSILNGSVFQGNAQPSSCESASATTTIEGVSRPNTSAQVATSQNVPSDYKPNEYYAVMGTNNDIFTIVKYDLGKKTSKTVYNASWSNFGFNYIQHENNIYITNGRDPVSGTIHGGVTVFDTSINAISHARKIARPAYFRYDAASALCNGNWYIAGGKEHDNKVLDVVERWDFVGKWYEVAHLSIPRANFALVELRGILYAIGGMTTKGDLVPVIERYAPNENVWKRVFTLYETFFDASAIAHKGRIYIVGGGDKVSQSDTVSRMRTNMIEWEPHSYITNIKKGLKTPRRLPLLVNARQHSQDHSLVAMGGYTQSGTGNTLILSMEEMTGVLTNEPDWVEFED